jgi:hypothetical protein
MEKTGFNLEKLHSYLVAPTETLCYPRHDFAASRYREA